MTEHVEMALYEVLLQMAENLPLFKKLDLSDLLPKNLTFTEMHTMTLIGRLGAPRMSELAARGHVTQGTMTGMINKLVDKGYVKRTRGTKDRRVVQVRLTAEGRRVDKIHEQHHMDLIDKIAHALTKPEQRQVVKIIHKIAEVLE